jgi:hypothetical protein
MDARFLRDDKFIAVVALGETFVMGPLCIIVALLYKTEKIVSFLNNIIKDSQRSISYCSFFILNMWHSRLLCITNMGWIY